MADADEIRDLARQHAVEALHCLVRLMGSPDPQVSLAAAVAILDRACGKPVQPIQISAIDSGSELAREIAEVTGQTRPARSH